jgi:hypothetical protein
MESYLDGLYAHNFEMSQFVSMMEADSKDSILTKKTSNDSIIEWHIL